MAGLIALAAALYETDRRQKSSSATADQNLTEVDLRIQILNSQIHILTARLDANERQIQALSNQVQALTDHYDSRVARAPQRKKYRSASPITRDLFALRSLHRSFYPLQMTEEAA